MSGRKSEFIGVRLTPEQEEILKSLQNVTGMNKTGVLIKGLELLARQYGLLPGGSASSPTQGALLELDSAFVALDRLQREVRAWELRLEELKKKTGEVRREMTEELAKIDEITERYGNNSSALIQVLLDIQKENNWLSGGALEWVARKLQIPLNRVYHVATFYKAFSLIPKGRHQFCVCMGTACHVRGAPRLLDRVQEILKIKPGETSSDLRFSLSTVNCLGCCALGPVLEVDGEYLSDPSTKKLEEIVEACE